MSTVSAIERRAAKPVYKHSNTARLSLFLLFVFMTFFLGFPLLPLELAGYHFPCVPKKKNRFVTTFRPHLGEFVLRRSSYILMQPLAARISEQFSSQFLASGLYIRMSTVLSTIESSLRFRDSCLRRSTAMGG